LVRSRDVARLQRESAGERDRAVRTETAYAEAVRKRDELRAELQGEKIARATAEVSVGRVATLEADLRAVQAKLAAVSEDKARLETEHVKDRQAQEEKIAVLTTLRGDMEKEMTALAGEALQSNQASFLLLAEQVLEKHKQRATGDLEQRHKAIESLLAPIAATLEEYRKGLGEVEKARLEAYSGLANELQHVVRTQADVSAQTRKLVNALQAAPKTRGRWGEQQLQNVMELSGMTAYVDFTPEEQVTLHDTRLRPDVIIRLPGDRRIVVDAKTSMAAYLDAVEATDDDTREAHLLRHAQQLRQHMKSLAAKSYWEALPITPDFVVMFVPGENFFAAAMERDGQLFEDGIAARVLIVTPTTLIALAKAIAFGWRQEKVADNARKVADLGRDLYKRLATMGGHIVEVGKSLERTVKHFNGFVGSIEHSVMSQARKFYELEVEGTQDALPALLSVDTETRQVRRDRDLVVTEATVEDLLTSKEVQLPS
jgi:DNA recombination protein RmuC